MKKLSKKILLLALVSIPALFGSIQNVCDQPSLHDSLRNMLDHFEEKTKAHIIKKAAKEAKAFYTSNTIGDSLSKKLLIADSVLVNAVKPEDQQITLSYAETLVQLFKHLPPAQNHPDYAASLNNLALLHFAMGQYDKTQTLYEQLLAIRKRTTGDQYPFYANSLIDLETLREIPYKCPYGLLCSCRPIASHSFPGITDSSCSITDRKIPA